MMYKFFMFAKKAWHDPVWSKVIATTIVGLFGIIAAALFHSQPTATRGGDIPASGKEFDGADGIAVIDNDLPHKSKRYSDISSKLTTRNEKEEECAKQYPSISCLFRENANE